MSDERLSGLAFRRRVDGAELCRQLTGDLDWIVQKAIAWRPDDRYGSAAELAAEIGRYLDHEPVLAGPRTLRYRLGKLIRRHRLPILAASVAMLALIVATVGVTFGLFRARHEAEAARQARAEEAQARQGVEEVSRFLVGLFEVSDPRQARGREVTARELLEQGARRISHELEDQPLLRARMMATLGQVHFQLGLYQQALPLLGEALELRRAEHGAHHLDVAESLVSLGEVLRKVGRFDEAAERVSEGLRMERELLGAERASEAFLLRARAILEPTGGEDGMGAE